MTYHVTSRHSAFCSRFTLYIPVVILCTTTFYIYKLHVLPTQRVCRKRPAVAEQSSAHPAELWGAIWRSNVSWKLSCSGGLQLRGLVLG